MYICDICCVGIICFGIILDCIVILADCFFFGKSILLLLYCWIFFRTNNILTIYEIIFGKSCWLFL
jgi:hypothetical protein